MDAARIAPDNSAQIDRPNRACISGWAFDGARSTSSGVFAHARLTFPSRDDGNRRLRPFAVGAYLTQRGAPETGSLMGATAMQFGCPSASVRGSSAEPINKIASEQLRGANRASSRGEAPGARLHRRAPRPRAPQEARGLTPVHERRNQRSTPPSKPPSIVSIAS